MGFLSSLFTKEVTKREIRVKLRALERDRKKKVLEMEKNERKKEKAIAKMKEARRIGNDMETDYLWDELKGLKIDSSYLLREAKVLKI